VSQPAHKVGVVGAKESEWNAWDKLTSIRSVWSYSNNFFQIRSSLISTYFRYIFFGVMQLRHLLEMLRHYHTIRTRSGLEGRQRGFSPPNMR